MPDFTCSVCGSSFAVPQTALDKYPGWTPRYCREHSPNKKSSNTSQSRGKKSFGGNKSVTVELDLTLEEVLAKFSGGPQDGIFTDGSARPNPGPGGWGLVYVKGGEILESLHGQEAHTTNNRMELRALIEAFKIIKPSESVTVYTDSNLCVNIVTKWAAGWKKNGWKKKTGPIKNLELVTELYALYEERPQLNLQWIKAHNGWLWNEYADSLATAWAREEL